MAKVSDLFDVIYGHSLELNRLPIVAPEDGVPFVSRKMGDNGISAYVQPIAGVEPAAAGALSCALGGNGVLSTFLQERPFYTGRDVAILRPLEPLTKARLLFYALCIKRNRFRYSYGRQANRSLKDIVVPDISDIPDYVDRVEVDLYSGKDEPAKASSKKLADLVWKKFPLINYFDMRKGKRITKAKMVAGNTPFVSAIDSNNGVSNHLDVRPSHAGGQITVNYNGNGVAEAFYQASPFWASDDVNILYPRFDLTPEAALFICAVIRREKYRFSYGRKWNLERMKLAEVYLPCSQQGEPDFAVMAEYIQGLKFSGAVSDTSSLARH